MEQEVRGVAVEQRRHLDSPRRLTKRFLDTLEPGDSPVHVYDRDLPGFLITVLPSGRMTFGVRYGSRRKRRWLRLGRYGVLTLEEAREAARKVLATASLGGDPAMALQEKAAEPTLKEWVEDYLREARKTKKSWKEDERYLGVAVQRLGRRSLSEITPSDIESLRSKLSDTPTAANRLLASVSACFASAVQLKKTPNNPAKGIPHYRENPPRSRVLTEAELHAFGVAVEAERERDPGAWVALRLLLETGCRIGEALSAKWADMELDALRWKLPNPKAQEPQTIVLDASTAKWLQAVKDGADGSYVVRGARPKAQRYDIKAAWERVRKAAMIQDATIHDIRRTFGKLIAREAGLHMATALLRHSDPRITARVYAPHAETEMRAAVTRVLPFLRRAAS